VVQLLGAGHPANDSLISLAHGCNIGTLGAFRQQVENKRYCKICQRDLSQQNPGSICVVCQDNITKSIGEKSYYDTNDLTAILGVGPDQIRKLGREGKIPGKIPGKQHHYLKPEVDNWVNSDHIYHRSHPRPVGPLQEEAYQLCQNSDHRWLIDESFLGHASTSQTSSELKDNLVKISTKYKCYFCGHEIVRPMV